MRPRFYLSCGGLAAAAVVTDMALAQSGEDTARLLSLDVSQGLEWSDNPNLDVNGDSAFTSRTDLGFRLNRQSSIDRFSIAASTELELGDENAGNTVQQSFLRFGWDRAVRRSNISANVNMSEVSLDTSQSVTDADTGDTNFVTLDNGTRRGRGFALSGGFGTNTPFGGTYALSLNETRYSNTTDTSLRDTDRTSATFGLFLELDPRLRLRLDSNLSDTDQSGTGALDTKITGISTGVDMDISPRLTSSLDLGWQKVEETRELTARSTSGTSVSGTLDWALPNGTLGISADSRLDASGRRSSLRLHRSQELVRANLSYSIGVTHDDNDELNPVYGLNYRQDLPRAQLTLGLTQSTTTDSDNAGTINSLFTAGYNQDLTPLSSLGAQLTLRSTNRLGDGAADSRRIDFAVTYRHELAREWDAVGSLTLARLQEDGLADRSANTLFVGVEKRFQWR